MESPRISHGVDAGDGGDGVGVAEGDYMRVGCAVGVCVVFSNEGAQITRKQDA